MTDGFSAGAVQAPAGWYADPSGFPQWRYWDGAQWTEYVAPVQQPTPPASKYDLPDGQRYVGPIKAIILGFKQYAEFNGRSSRSEFFWWWAITYLVQLVFIVPLVISFIVLFVDAIHSSAAGAPPPQNFAALNLLVIPANLWSIAVLVPSIAVAVRRLHDIGYSGWYYLFFLIPFAGFVLMIVWGSRQGIEMPNQYGPPPRKGEPTVRPTVEVAIPQ